MGTASTMACLTVALGLILLRGGATASAVSGARLRIAEQTGAHAVCEQLKTSVRSSQFHQ